MRYFIKLLLVVSFALFSFNSVQAQVKKSKRLKKAELAFEAEEYHLAADLFKKAYKKTKSKALKAEIIFKQAECFRLSGNTKRAESFYKRVVSIPMYPSLTFSNVEKVVEDLISLIQLK